MKRIGDAATVTDGLIPERQDVGVAASLDPRNVGLGPVVDRQLATRLDHVQDAMDHLIHRQPVPWRRPQRPASLPVPHAERLQARPLPSILEKKRPRARHKGLLAEGTRGSTVLLPIAKNDPSGWQRLHRLISPSGLGWAFVLVGVLWGLFAFAFSQCDGCGWDKGRFFFAWSLGILAFGFCLRTTRKRPTVSRFFLAVNIFMVSVLSMVVATR